MFPIYSGNFPRDDQGRLIVDVHGDRTLICCTHSRALLVHCECEHCYWLRSAARTSPAWADPQDRLGYVLLTPP